MADDLIWAGDWTQPPRVSGLTNHAYVMKPPGGKKKKQKYGLETPSGFGSTWKQHGRSRRLPMYLFHLAVLESHPFIISQWSNK